MSNIIVLKSEIASKRAEVKSLVEQLKAAKADAKAAKATGTITAQADHPIRLSPTK